MSAILLDGKKLAEKVKQSIIKDIDGLSAKYGRRPGLGVILIGDNPASHVYVAAKEKFAEEAGMRTFDIRLPASATQVEAAAAVEKLNSDGDVDGILLQLPLPNHLSQSELINLISPAKDSDGLHPLNQGLLLRGEGELRSCTPRGSMRLIDLAYSGKSQELESLEYSQLPEVDLSGKSAIVIGRSILVGKPLALMLLERNATVTMAHSRTADLSALCRQADIVVAAVGKPRFIPGGWIKKGAVVIDVGINRGEDGKLTGDVNFEEAKAHAAFISPVPKGVGPMTIAMLVENTLRSYRRTLAG